MSSATLVIGGCRSGKSDHAQCLAEAFGGRLLYVATCVPRDDEMHERVRRHREKRPTPWETCEAPLDMPEAIVKNKHQFDVLLVDCLTLWVSNLLLESTNDGEMARRVRALTEAIHAPGCPLVLVTNEVGTGIVPENALARKFRDEAGRVNRAVAEAVGTVIWMVAGIPVTVKPNDGKGA